MTIKIEWISDSYYCENCGSSFANGAIVTMPDGAVLDFTPVAACWDSVDYDPADIYRAVIIHLGHTIVEKYEVEDSED